jgi:hypothetical protein
MKLSVSQTKNMCKKYIVILLLFLSIMMVVSGCKKNNVKNQTKSIVNEQNEIIASTTKKIEEKNSTSTENIVATTTEIDTSEWQMYRNKEYGFVLKFPMKWNLKEDSWIQSGNKQNYIMISNPSEKSYLIIDKRNNDKIEIDRNMNVKMLNNIMISGYKTEIAYIENNLNEDYFRYFINTDKGNFKIYFMSNNNTETEISIFYDIISSIKFD